MGKKGSSLVELIAVIVIMGIIASVATVTIINVINRQRKNATVNGLNNIYSFMKERLLSVETGNYEDFITLIDDDFCYASLTNLIDSGAVDGESYKPEGAEVYFCYDFSAPYVVITSSDITKTKPTETDSTIVNSASITFSYTKDQFIPA